MTRRVRALLAAVPVAAIALAGLVAGRSVRAADPPIAEANALCATRLSITLLGKAPSASLLAAPDPHASVDAMVADPAFIERFARFANAEMNSRPGMTPDEEPGYDLAKYVLTNAKPWKDMFVGRYAIGRDANDKMTVTDDATGLGFFRNVDWQRRYAGNEKDGYKLPTAYRIMNAVVGLQLVASTNAPDADTSVTGRQAQPCAGCHFDNWYALDKVARVLTRRQGKGATMTFTPPTDGPQQILGGKTITNDEDLVKALVDSDSFKVQTCRLAFRFLYGRSENQCEGPVFDRCVDALVAKGTMQAAVSVLAKDPGFCR